MKKRHLPALLLCAIAHAGPPLITDDPDTRNGLLRGLAIDQKLIEQFSFLAEVYGESAGGFRDAEWVATVGFHWQADEHAALIGSIGRGLNEGEEAEAKLLSYIGVQFTF